MKSSLSRTSTPSTATFNCCTLITGTSGRRFASGSSDLEILGSWTFLVGGSTVSGNLKYSQRCHDPRRGGVRQPITKQQNRPRPRTKDHLVSSVRSPLNKPYVPPTVRPAPSGGDILLAHGVSRGIAALSPLRPPSPAPAAEGGGVWVRLADPRLSPWATIWRPLRGLNSSTNF